MLRNSLVLLCLAGALGGCSQDEQAAQGTKASRPAVSAPVEPYNPNLHHYEYSPPVERSDSYIQQFVKEHKDAYFLSSDVAVWGHWVGYRQSNGSWQCYETTPVQ